MKRLFCFISALCMGAGALTAQTPPDQKKVVPLGELVVSVTRSDRSVREIPVNVTVLSKEQIRLSGSNTVPDLLRTIPGLVMRDYQGTVAVSPTRQAPALRGLGGTSASRTLVLVDGVPVDDPFTSWMYWGRIPLDLVERIEIVRGGSAGIWGNRALGGVINIITRRPAESTGRISLQGGGWTTGRADASISTRTDKLGIALAGEWFETDGYFVLPEASRTPIDVPSGTRHKMGFARFEYQANSNLAFNLSTSLFSEDRNLATHYRRQSTDIGQVQGGVNLTTSDGSRWNLSGFGARKGGTQTSASESVDRKTETPSTDQFRAPAQSAGVNLQWSRGWGTMLDLSAGADLFWTDGEANENARWVTNQFTRLRVNAGTQMYRGLYLQSIFTPAQRLNIVASGRVDFWRNYNGLRSEQDIQNGTMLVDSSYAAESGSHFSYNLGVHYDLTDRLSWRGSVYTAFRAPTLNELYKAGRESGNVTIESNAQLEAESLLGTEVGVDYLLGSKGVVRLTGFRNKLHDPIVDVTMGVATGGTRTIAPCGSVPSGGTCRQRQNLGLVRSYGLEAELEVAAADNLHLRGTYSWNPTEVLDAPGQPQILGKSARSVPEHSATARVDYLNPRFVGVAVTGRWVGERFDDDINTITLEQFFVLDVVLSREIRQRWEIFGGVENVLGAEYAISKNAGNIRTGAPRLILTGVRARW
jgi:outer membrane cobalamin receptor